MDLKLSNNILCLVTVKTLSLAILAVLTISVTLYTGVILVSSTVNGVSDSPTFVRTAIKIVFISFTVEHGPPYFACPLVCVWIIVSIPSAEAKHSTENLCIPLIPVTITYSAPFPTNQHLHSSITEITSFHSVTYTCKEIFSKCNNLNRLGKNNVFTVTES